MRIRLAILSLLLVWVALCPAQLNLKPDMVYITVGISGYVDNPGNYKLLPVDRLSDAVAQTKLAEELKQLAELPGSTEMDAKKLNPIPVLREEGQMFPNFPAYQSMRDVRLIRNGNETSYDLLAFFRTGDQSQNPFLRDSDQIHIPLIKENISVNGSVGFPGDMEYREGDTVRKVIDLALGTLPGADLSAVRHSIYDPAAKTFTFRTLDMIANPELWDIRIQPGDRLMVPYDAQYRNKIAISVSGELQRAGEYTVPENTSLWEIIQMAGGISNEADISNAVILNKLFNMEPDPEFERIRMRSMAELTPLEYSYLRIKLRQAKGRYSVDFKKLFASEGREGDIRLKNGDFVYIPQKLDMVWVSGQVKRPGLVPYQEGKSWKYYVDQTGGYTSNRNRFGTRILRANSGNWVKASSKVELRPGDMVFIPDRQDRHFWTDVKDIIGVTASAITILIGVNTLTK
jgi:protein involved in polysaccharide export with SLBB domain